MFLAYPDSNPLRKCVLYRSNPLFCHRIPHDRNSFQVGITKFGNMKRKSQLPGWVLKHKRRGTEVKTVGSGYYLCEVKSVWDPEKKRAKKISGKYLGKITRDGLVKPKHERVLENLKDVTVKEFGATYLLQSMNEDIAGLLKELYPDEWKELFIFSIFRLKNNSPLKNVIYHYNDSYLSEMIDDARVSPKVLGRLLRDIGRRRERITQFLKEFVTGVDFAVST